MQWGSYRETRAYRAMVGMRLHCDVISGRADDQQGLDLRGIQWQHRLPSRCLAVGQQHDGLLRNLVCDCFVLWCVDLLRLKRRSLPVRYVI